MLRNDIYYGLKPLIPKAIRMGLRRSIAARKRRRVSDVWPIMPGSEREPEGWSGWPEGKKFAVVLTHDIETQAGLEKCEQLMRLERALGFRSSFNFIPEGSYKVPSELREELVRNGFEVGVHDLNHDGRLYRSRREFGEKAKRINHYLKEWGTVGFRSGFMLSNLDWLHELQIGYDMSTFDTDPFEPQPEGGHTIFPFWVPRPRALNSQPSTLNFRPGGYVELPYTLPQDSTLFLLLRETTIDIWKHKVDWIAGHGGMVLLDTHPDYMTFEGKCPTTTEYSVDLYAQFLTDVRCKYQGQYWQALPREVAAAFCRPDFVEEPCDAGGEPPTPYAHGLANFHPSPRGPEIISISPETSFTVTLANQSPRARILMLVENHYPQDTRVRNEASLLTNFGYRVSVVCLKKPGQRAVEEVTGVLAYRIPPLELFKKTPSANANRLALLFLKFKSFVGYVLEYAYFTSACFAMACYLCLRRGFDVIHVHNPPDTLFLVGLPFRLLGKKFVYDHHDLCPELYQSRYRAERGLYTALLTILEWCSLKLANVTIATNETYKQKQIERSGKAPERIFVVRNGPSESRMQAPLPSERLRRLGKTILCYIGSLNPQDGVDYLLRSLSHLRHDLRREDFYCVIMGSGDSLEDLRSLLAELSLEGVAELTGFVSDRDLMENLAAADICVDPDPSSPLNDVSTWIKIMEYMACGKPIVSFDLKETRFSAQDAALFVPPNDERAFACAIARLMDDPALRQTMGSFGRQRVERELRWSVTGMNLLAAYNSLFPEPETNAGCLPVNAKLR